MPEPTESAIAIRHQEQSGTKLFTNYEPVLNDVEDLQKIVLMIFGISSDTLTIQELSALLLEDKKIVRQKYGRPAEEIWRNSPEEYYNQLESSVAKAGVPLREKREFESFFKERGLAHANFFESTGIIAQETLRDNDSSSDVAVKAATLEHEFIHALQQKRYSQMPLIRQEYEAYIAHASEDSLEKKPELFLERFIISLNQKEFTTAWQDYQAKTNGN